MNVLALYSDDEGAPKQHIIQGATDDFSVDGFDLSTLPECNTDGTIFFVVLDDIDRPSVFDGMTGDELPATFRSA